MPNHCLNQCSLLVSWTLENNLQWNFNQNIIFVCRSQCVKPALCAQYQFTVSNIPNLWAEPATSLQTSLGCKLKCIPSHTANKLVWSIRLQDPKGLNSTRNMCMCPLISPKSKKLCVQNTTKGYGTKHNTASKYCLQAQLHINRRK